MPSVSDNVSRLRPGGAPRLEIVTRLTAPDVDAVTWLAEQATEADGVRPLSEHVTLHLRYGGDEPVKHVLLRSDGEISGYAHLDVSDAVAGPSAELFVDAQRRRHGLGAALLRELQRETAGRRLRVWAHGDLPSAAALAAHHGLGRTRTLLQLRRPLGLTLAAPVIPEGVTLRPFVAADAEAWLRVNARAFADHPEQGRWTESDLRLRMGESWFSEAGFLLATRGERLAGFVWTKVHGGRSPVDERRHAHDPIGEIYVVGVDPDEQGTGLGRALVLAGLHHLRTKRIDVAMLYVDSDNMAAMRLYAALAFVTHSTDVMYTADALAPHD